MDASLSDLLTKLKDVFQKLPDSEGKKELRKVIEDLVDGNLKASDVKTRLGPLSKILVMGLLEKDGFREARLVLSLVHPGK